MKLTYVTKHMRCNCLIKICDNDSNVFSLHEEFQLYEKFSFVSKLINVNIHYPIHSASSVKRILRPEVNRIRRSALILHNEASKLENATKWRLCLEGNYVSLFRDKSINERTIVLGRFCSVGWLHPLHHQLL